MSVADARPAVAEAVRQIDRLGTAVGRERLDAFGDEASGAGTMYADRFRAGRVLSGYEQRLVVALCHWAVCPRRIVEIGGGLGGASLLAAAMGFEAICYEMEESRIALGEAILAAIAPAFPGIAERVTFVRAIYPATIRHDTRGALGLCTNIAATVSDVQRDTLIDALNAFGSFVVDVDRFLAKITTDAERRQVVARFEAVGASGEPFLDLGDDARFWRFGGFVPACARRLADVLSDRRAAPPITDLHVDLMARLIAFPRLRTIVDGGADGGGLALLAAAAGRDGVRIDPDPQRRDAATALGRDLSARLGWPADRYRVVADPAFTGGDGGVRFGLDPSHFGQGASDLIDLRAQPDLLATLEAQGRYGVPLIDLGANGDYWLFGAPPG